MLIGSSDGATADRGKLRVTLHHNLFRDVGQRAPRVRFGQVHVYNNYYDIGNPANYVYSWGVGRESAIYAENNFIRTHQDIDPSRFIQRLNGTALFETGTLLDGKPDKNAISVFDAYNAANDPDLVFGVGWIPSLFIDLMPTSDVFPVVQAHAGP